MEKTQGEKRVTSGMFEQKKSVPGSIEQHKGETVSGEGKETGRKEL